MDRAEGGYSMAMRFAFIRLVTFVVCAGTVIVAQRPWQQGKWRDISIDRPKISVGIVTRDPNNRLPQQASVRERRKYVIENATHRFELQQDTTADTPRVDVEVGESVTFAIEKKTVYVKGTDGREHRFTLTKQSALPK